jgi:GntR family transcriptional repressor for pyruvate dehydrogenase complex
MAQQIIKGVPRPGDRLPREVDLASEYGISRGTVREAIRGLEERGLVRVRHGHGAVVMPQSEWDVLDPDVLSAILDDPLAGADALREIIEARLLLETEAASLAAIRSQPPQLAEIRKALQQMRELAESKSESSQDAFLVADLSFHAAIILASGNRALGRMIAPIHASLLHARRALARPQYRRERAVPEHAAVLDAIEAQDPGAAREAMAKVFATVTVYLDEYEVAAQGTVDGAQAAVTEGAAARNMPRQ